MAVIESDNTSLINPFGEILASPGLGEDAQPPPYAASPTRWLSSPSWSGISGICELPNTSPIWLGTYPVTEMGTAGNAAALTKSGMSEGETSRRKRDDSHSVSTEYSDEDELYRMPQVMVELAEGLMVSPPRTNSPQPLGDYPGNLESDMLWNFEERSEFEEVQTGKEVMRPCIEAEPESMGGMPTVQQSWDSHPHRNDDHSVNGDGLSHIPTQLPVNMMVSSPRMNFSDEEALFHMPTQLPVNTMVSSPRMNFYDEEALFHMPTQLPVNTMVSSPRMNFSDEEALFHMPTQLLVDMAGGMVVSSLWMNSSLPSGNFDWVSSSNGEFKEVHNGKEMMRPTWKQPCMQVAAIAASALGQNQTHMPIPLPVDMMASSSGAGMNCSLPSDDSLGSFDPDSLWDDVKCNVVQELPNWEETVRDFCLSYGAAFFLCSEGVSQSIGEKLQLPNRINILRLTVTPARIEVNFSSENNFTIALLLQLEPESWEGMMEQKNDEQIGEFKLVSLEMLLYQVFRYKPTLLEELRNTGSKRLAVETKCSGGKMVHTVSYYTKSAATNAKANNTSKKKGTTCRWQKDHRITREVLQQLFDKSRDDAAKSLNVSPSTLKRACRDFGITRWPNHKRKRANSSLNQEQAVQKHKGSQPCPQQAITTLQPNSPAVSVKVSYKNSTIRFPLSSSSTMRYLEEQLERKLEISLDNNFFIKYQDEEDEWITLTCDSELMHGMDVLRSSGKTVIRMEVTPKFD